MEEAMLWGFLGFLVGLFVGLFLGYRSSGLSMFRSAETKTEKGKTLSEEKSARMQVLRLYLSDKKEVTNEEVEGLLEVSDATAERYLQDLEEEGIIKQEGRAGPHVKYIVLDR